MEQLAEAGLPKNDFVFLSVSRNGNRFNSRIASFNDGIAMMRTLLILSGMKRMRL